jgi:Aminotransferase class I and II
VISAAVATLCNPGDEILVPDPHWPTYNLMAAAYGATSVWYPCLPEAGYLPDIDRLEGLITSRTRLIITNSPNNPTGAVLPHETLSALSSTAEAHNLWILSDESYDQIIFDGDGAAPSMASVSDPERTVSAYGQQDLYDGRLAAWIRGRSTLCRRRLGQSAGVERLKGAIIRVAVSGSSVVLVDETSELVAPADLPAGQPCFLLGLGRAELDRTMRSLGVVVADVDAQHPFEVAAVQDQQPVETVGARGADEAFGDRVRLRSYWSLHDPNPLAAEDLVEGAAVFAVTRIRKRTPCLAKSRPRLRACWVTQPPVGLVVQPARILACEPQHQLPNLSRQRRSSALASRLSPLPAHQRSMPAEQRTRRNEQRHPRGAWQVERGSGQQGSIRRSELWPRNLATQDLELMAQHQQLDVLHIEAAAAANKRTKQRPKSEVKEREDHASDPPSSRPEETRHEYWRPSATFVAYSTDGQLFLTACTEAGAAARDAGA